MNGIEKILGKLQEDGKRETDEILDQAQRQADQITQRHTDQAAQLQADLMEKGRRAAEERRERLASVAQMEAKKMILATKQELLDKAFALAHEKLTRLSPEEYINLLSSLAAGASHSGQEAVTLNPIDRKTVGKQVVADANKKLAQAGKPAGLTLSKDAAEITGGLLLGDGSSEVNCAFDTLLRLRREDMAGQVAAVLFDQ